MADMASLDRVLPMESLPRDDRSHVAVYVVASVVPVTALVVSMRFYTRWAVVKSVGIDDWAILAAMVGLPASVLFYVSVFELTWFGGDQLLVIPEAVFQCLMAQTGLGKHAWMLTEKMTLRFYQVQYPHPVHRWYVAIIIFYTDLGIVKVALLLQYRRLFAAKIQRLIDWALGIVVVWTVIIVSMCDFTCWPIPGFWDKRIPAKCLPRYQYIVQSVGNILSDWVIFALPLPLLWRMRASLWHRLSLIMLFCLGFFTCAIGFVKIMYLPVKPSNDDLYRQVDSASWSLGELCAAIVVACLPVLRPLFSPGYRALVALGQLEAGEMLRPNFELEKRQPAIEIFPSNMHDRIEEGETCTDAPSGDYTDPASVVNWTSDANAAVPTSPAPIHLRSTNDLHRRAGLEYDVAEEDQVKA
ncbi:integral membrane protein [Diaporthe eres]|nr:integral membrane protein [Diaporthe eres]